MARAERSSSTAQAVALVRAHAHHLGVIEDPLARAMLGPRPASLERFLRQRPFDRLARSAITSFIAARTLAIDDLVREALDAGTGQVLILGAGYDTRAWRLARPRARFIEVDHPVTQADKRARAPHSGPTYVPLDLVTGSLVESLRRATFDPGRPSVTVLEGVTMYLDRPTVTTLLTDLATVTGAGSRLAVTFTEAGGGSVAPLSRGAAWVFRTMFGRAGEPIVEWAVIDELPELLASTGWSVDAVWDGPALAERYLAGSALPITGVSSRVALVSARRDAVNGDGDS